MQEGARGGGGEGVGKATCKEVARKDARVRSSNLFLPKVVHVDNIASRFYLMQQKLPSSRFPFPRLITSMINSAFCRFKRHGTASPAL